MTRFSFHNNIEEIGSAIWQQLTPGDYPFLRYEFLHALEHSGSVCADTGWQPCHLLISQAEQPIAVMPLYLKSHSYGEYVFDWAWADAYHRHGINYYPKLLTAIPFTPASGPRLSFAPSISDPEKQQLIAQTVQALQQFGQQHGASGWHGLFLEPGITDQLRNCGLITRLGTQYHWFNEGYTDFDNFLASFNSRKRKNLKKERLKVNAQGITHQFISGHEINAQLLTQFYQFYQMTYLKRGRKGYLTQEFFQLLIRNMPQQLVLCIAYANQQPVAAALSLKSSKTLYGRYWGCLDEFDSLHFETCYYQGIEYCIKHGLERFDPGAQGEHKIQRGFKPIETWSAHWIEDPAFRDAIERFLEEEEPLVRADINALCELLPFRQQ
ncbi:MAG: GNAT family N-acetyltransferase [Amphritea sp.]